MEVIHQPAFLYGQNLVECPRDMEADGWGIFSRTILIPQSTLLTPQSYFFFRQPSLVGTAIVHFVSVLPLLDRAKDRAELRQFNLSDARQLVLYLPFLHLQLFGVGQVLPFASATETEVLTARFFAYLTILYKPHHFTLSKAVLLSSDLYVNNVTWYAKRYEYNQVIPVEQRLSFGGTCFNLHLFQYR